MALISGGIQNLHQGVSQQPDPLRDPTQGDLQINGVSSPSDGLRKREGSDSLAKISSTAAPFEQVAFHHIRRDDANQYLAVISSATVRLFTLAGEEVPVTMAPGSASYLSAAGDASRDLWTATIGDYTFIVNRRVAPALGSGLTPLTARPSPHEALAWVKAANYGQTYELTLNGYTARVETAVTPTRLVSDEVVPNRISSAEIAARLRGGLLGGPVTGTAPAGGGVITLQPVLGPAKLNGSSLNVATTTDGIGYSLRVNLLGNGTALTGVTVATSGAGWSFAPGDKVYVPNTIINGGTDATPVHVATVASVIGNSACCGPYTKTNVPTTTNGGGSGLTVNITSNGNLITNVTVNSPGNLYMVRDKIYVGQDVVKQGDPDIQELVGSVTSITPPPLAYAVSIEQQGSVLHVKSQDPIRVLASDARANSDISAITNTVQSFTELPNIAPAGYQIEVTGSDTDKFDSYYVQFVPTTGFFSEGHWEECAAPGVQYKIDAATMPLLLVKLPVGSGFWVGHALEPGVAQPVPGLSLPSWGQRTAGDYESNPDPSFIGSTISDIFVYKNRLCFLTGESFVASRATKFFDFFRETVTTVLESDPIDQAASQDRISVLTYASQNQDQIILFSQQVQSLLSSDDASLSSASARISPLTEYEVDLGVRPIALAGALVFVQRNGDWSQVREFQTFGSGTSINAQATEITEHVRNYIPSEIRQMVCNEAGNILLLRSSKKCYRNRLYVYKYLNQNTDRGNTRVQSSWSYWEFCTDEIKSILVVNQSLYMVCRYGEEIWLERLSIADRPERKFAGENQLGDTLLLPHELYLDRKFSNTLRSAPGARVAQGIYDPVTDTTCWTLPFTPRCRVQAWTSYLGPYPNVCQTCVTVVAIDANAAEPVPGGTVVNPGQFKITRDGSLAGSLTVNITYAGTATNGVDYQALPATVTFAPGAADVLLDVIPIGDALTEGAETVLLFIAPGPDYVACTPNSATVTIGELLLPVVTVAATDPSGSESGPLPSADCGSSTLSQVFAPGFTLACGDLRYEDFGTPSFGAGRFPIFNFARSGYTYEMTIDFPQPLTLGVYSFTFGAICLPDYVDIVDVQVIAPGSSESGANSMPPLGLQAGSYGIDPYIEITTNSASVSQCQILITLAYYTSPGEFTLTRSGSTVSPLTVNVGYTGTAVNSVDYQTLPSTVTFAAGSSTAVINVNPIYDQISEPVETVVMSILSGTGYLPAATGNTATVNITSRT